MFHDAIVPLAGSGWKGAGRTAAGVPPHREALVEAGWGRWGIGAYDRTMRKRKVERLLLAWIMSAAAWYAERWLIRALGRRERAAT
jgi:hypothetical protein